MSEEVTLKDLRKVAVLGWDTGVVKGTTAIIEVADEEKRDVKNDGESNIFFPLDFVGQVEVTVSGSHGGSATGVIDVT